jgi:hypothetical protein
MRLLKYLLNFLIVVWVYHAFIKPIIHHYFPSITPKTPQNNAYSQHKEGDINIKTRPKDNEGEYIDYEEIKK